MSAQGIPSPSLASSCLCLVSLQRPQRLHRKPSSAPAVEVMPAGASYNPTFEDHQVGPHQAPALCRPCSGDSWACPISYQPGSLGSGHWSLTGLGGCSMGEQHRACFQEAQGHWTLTGAKGTAGEWAVSPHSALALSSECSTPVPCPVHRGLGFSPSHHQK